MRMFFFFKMQEQSLVLINKLIVLHTKPLHSKSVLHPIRSSILTEDVIVILFMIIFTLFKSRQSLRDGWMD